MSLDWDVSKVANWKETTQIIATYNEPMRGIEKGKAMLHPVTHTLIFSTMAVGMGEITEANHMEFFTRLRLWELIHPDTGMSAGQPDDPVTLRNEKITYSDVKNHIGLSTNVSYETEAKWIKRIFAAFKDRDVPYLLKEPSLADKIAAYYKSLDKQEG